MIFYFSGTGNSKWIASEIAKKLNDEVKNINDIKSSKDTICVDNGGIKSIKLDEKVYINNSVVGIVFPVYAWSYPKNIEKFLKNLEVQNSYIFAIAVCASEAGYSIKHLGKIIKLNAGYSMSMPNNYMVSYTTDKETLESYEDESESEIKEKINNAKIRIDEIIENIKTKKNIFDVNMGKLAFIKSNLANKMFNKYARNTKSFTCDTSLCDGCGLCEKICSAKTIKIEDNKPVWGEECYQCMACIHRCPKEAINLGTYTKNKKRYYIEKYL